MMNRKILIIVDRGTTIVDFLAMTGLKNTNFWFQHIAKTFCAQVTICNDYTALVKFLFAVVAVWQWNTTGQHAAVDYVVRQLNAFDVNSDTLIDKQTFVIEHSLFHVDFRELSSRKFKVVIFE